MELVAIFKKSHLSKVAFLLPDAQQIRDTLRGELSLYPHSPSESFHRDITFDHAWLIKKRSRFFPAIQLGGLPRPLHVLPDFGS
jgi:hypothetical protein